MTEPQVGPGGRRRPVTEEQWAAARELIEGMPATSIRVAGAAGMDLSYFRKRAARECWRKVDYRHQDVLELHREAVALSASYVGVGKLSLDDIGGPHAAPGEGDAVDEAAGGTAGAVTLERAQSFLSRQMDRLMVRAERGGRLPGNFRTGCRPSLARTSVCAPTPMRWMTSTSGSPARWKQPLRSRKARPSSMAMERASPEVS